MTVRRPFADEHPASPIPREFNQFAKHTPGALPAGSPGKNGRVVLRFATDTSGRTVWTTRSHRTPLHMMRPLYPDPNVPNTPTAYIMSTGGGLVQGDRTRLDISVGNSAHAVVTSQAATKVHRMDTGYATNETHVRVDAGALLEFMPDPILCFPGARLHQTLHADIAEGGGFIAADCVVIGRDDTAESVPDLVISTTRVDRLDTPIAIDRMRVDATTAVAPGVLEGVRSIANIIVITPEAAMIEVALAAMRDVTVRGAAIGVSTLRDSQGIWARVCTTSGVEPAVRSISALWSAIRPIVVGAAVPPLRKK